MLRKVCPACLSENKSEKYFISSFKICQCNECKTLFVENLPSKKELSELYKSDSYYLQLPDDSAERIKEENKRRIKNIIELNVHGKVLDVGCANGLFLDKIRKENFETFGIELSEKNVELCRSKGHKVFHGDIDSYLSKDFKAGEFNLIVCLDVIEHIENTSDFISKLRTLLKLNGILIISTPNFSGIISKILRRKNPFITPPEHINFFTKPGLRKLVSDSGFKIIREETYGYITDAGLERTIEKYFPAFLNPFSFLLKPIINHTTRSLNYFKAGLELEFYLKNAE